MITRRDIPTWLPLALLVLATVALFHRLLNGEVLFWGLPALQFYPWRHVAFQELRAGQLPGWNPYVGAGAPLLANYQTAVFYPPNWLFLLLPDPHAMSLIALLHLLWGGLGMWRFSGSLGLHTFGRGMSTLAYALSGHLIGRVGSFPTADAMAWIPWLFWLVQNVLERRRLRDVGWLGLAFGMQLLAGHAQTTWYSLVALILYVLWQVTRSRRGIRWRQRAAALILIGLGLALGVGIAAIQLIPTFEYLRESQRSGGLDYDTLTNLSYHPARLITLLSPNFYGTPADGSYFTNGIYFEDAAYIGFIPLISAAAAIVGRWRRRQYLLHYPTFATVPFWTLLALGGLALAMGRYTALFPLLYDHVPTFDAFREPVRWMILPVFGLSVLAGIGTQNWGRGKWTVFWSRLAAAGGGAAVVMALAAQQFIEQDSEVLPVLTRAVIGLGSWTAVAALFTLTQPDRAALTSPLLWQTSVLIFVTLDLAWAGSGLNPTVPADFYREFGVSRPENGGRIYWFGDYEHEVKFERLFDLSDYHKARDQWPDVRTSRLPNLNMLDQISSLNNFDPFLPRYHSRYVALIEDLGERANALLQAAAVSEVYGKTPQGWEGEIPSFLSTNGEMPFAWLVPEAQWFESDEAIEEALCDPAWTPRQTVILSGEPPAAPDAPAMSAGTVTVIEQRANRLHYDVTSNGAGYLVISNTWYPGWTATVDGEETPIYRANLAFQAVAIPPGGGDVVLRFSPTHWEIGVGLSMLALVITVVLVLVGNLNFSRQRIPLPEDY